MAKDPRRNLVMVTADSLRADHCGFVNSDSDLTPALDQYADEGISFTNAIAPGPRTPSSMPAVFTGEFLTDDETWETGDWKGRHERIGRHMIRYTHLSEWLQQRGYETAAFTANPWTTRGANFDFGFDDFFEISPDSERVSSRHLSDSPLFKLANTVFETVPGDPIEWSWKKEWFSQWTAYFDLIQERLSQMSEPFFIWIFLMDSHQPYFTPRRFRVESSAWEMVYSILRYWHGVVTGAEIPPHAKRMIERSYRDTVRSVDAFVDSLIDEVSRYDPLTVFFSDHGEALGDHGHFGHEQVLYEENLRVPFFVHNAGSSERVTEQVSLRTLPEILLDLTGPTDFEPQTHTQPYVISKTEDNRAVSVRTPHWKFITSSEETCLYDLTSDPEESTDVLERYQEVASWLSGLVQRHETTQTEKELINTETDELLAAHGSL